MNIPEKLEFVITARHGEDSRDYLTEKGIEQIKELWRHIAFMVEGKNVLILTSTYLRAIQSGNVMLTYRSPTIPIRCKPIRELISGSYGYIICQLGVIIEAVEESTQVLIIITHGTSPSAINDALVEEGFGGNKIGETGSENGTGFMVTRGSTQTIPVPP